MATSKFQRTVKAATESFDAVARTIEGTFSSVTPYLRTFTDASGNDFTAWEILGHRTEDIDTAVLDIGACLCFQHNTNDVRGVIEAFTIVPEEKLHGLIRFAATEKGNEAMALIGDGIMRQLSVGYNHTSLRQIGEYEGYPVIYAKWKLNEVSAVTVGADVAMAGIGRSAGDSEITPLKEMVLRSYSKVAPTFALIRADETITTVAEIESTAVDTDNAQADSTIPELERVKTLEILGRAMNAEALAKTCIEDGSTTDIFKSKVDDFKSGLSAAKTKSKTKENKMDKFDLGRAFMNLHSSKTEGLEGEVSAELGAKLRNAGQNVSSNAILIPSFALSRSQTMGAATSGGNLLEQGYLPNQTVTPLHPAYVMDNLGITRLNLMKSSRFSKMEGTQYFLWSAAGATNTRASRETAALQKTSFTTSTDTLTPIRGGTYFEFSDQLGMELDPSFIQMCKNDLSVTIALEEQRVMFKGNGVNEPKGLDQRAIQTVVGLSAIPTRSELLSMKAKVAAVNGIPGKFLMSATMLYNCMGVPVGTAGKFLIEDNMTLLGTEVVVSNQIPDGEIWCAQWDSVLWADFGVLQIEIVRDADLALHGMNRYQVSLFADTNVKRESFIVKGVFV